MEKKLKTLPKWLSDDMNRRELIQKAQRRLAAKKGSPVRMATHDGQGGGDGEVEVLGIVVGRKTKANVGESTAKIIRGQVLVVRHMDGSLGAIPNDGKFTGTDNWMTVDTAQGVFADQPELYQKILNGISTNLAHRKDRLNPKPPSGETVIYQK